MQFSVDSASMPSKKLMGLFSFMADPRSDLLAKSSRDLRSRPRPYIGHVEQPATVRRSAQSRRQYSYMQRVRGRWQCMMHVQRVEGQSHLVT